MSSTDESKSESYWDSPKTPGVYKDFLKLLAMMNADLKHVPGYRCCPAFSKWTQDDVDFWYDVYPEGFVELACRMNPLLSLPDRPSRHDPTQEFITAESFKFNIKE